MKSLLRVIIVASFASTAIAASHSNLSVVAKRRELMKELAAHAKAIAPLIDRPNVAAPAIRRHALAMRALAKQMPALFMPGTGLDAVSAPRTGAKPAIWKQWERFEAAARQLANESERLRRMAPSASRVQLRLQFAATTMGACGGCHGAFRKKLD